MDDWDERGDVRVLRSQVGEAAFCAQAGACADCVDDGLKFLGPRPDVNIREPLTEFTLVRAYHAAHHCDHS